MLQRHANFLSNEEKPSEDSKHLDGQIQLVSMAASNSEIDAVALETGFLQPESSFKCCPADDFGDPSHNPSKNPEDLLLKSVKDAEDACCPSAEDLERKYLETRKHVEDKLACSTSCFCPNCKAEHYELAKHPLDRRAFHRNVPLELRSHNDYLLATLAANSFRIGKQSFEWGQIKAWYDWRAFWVPSSAGYQLLESGDFQNLPAAKVLNKPCEIFNQFFFLGQIPPAIIDLRWLRQDCKFYRGRDINLVRGQTWNCGYTTCIEINPDCYAHLKNPSAMLCTLLHEMVHAFLGRYSCYAPVTNCKIESCHALQRQNRGRDHGRAWQYLAKAIEDDGARCLVGLKIDLGRYDMAFLEIRNGGWRPTDCDLKDLFAPYAKKIRVWLECQRNCDDLLMRKRKQRGADAEV